MFERPDRKQADLRLEQRSTDSAASPSLGYYLAEISFDVVRFSMGPWVLVG